MATLSSQNLASLGQFSSKIHHELDNFEAFEVMVLFAVGCLQGETSTGTDMVTGATSSFVGCTGVGKGELFLLSCSFLQQT